MTIRLVIIAALTLTGCHSMGPCSPKAAAVIDSACAAAVAEVAERKCPDVATEDCLPALVAIAACNEVVEAHAKGCQR